MQHSYMHFSVRHGETNLSQAMSFGVSAMSPGRSRYLGIGFGKILSGLRACCAVHDMVAARLAEMPSAGGYFIYTDLG